MIMTTQHFQKPGLPLLRVSDAKRAARHWVEEKAPSFHSFRGALLRGSTVWMQDDEPWDDASDVDVTIYFADPHETIRHQKLRYEGVVLEPSPSNIDAIADPERLLGNPYDAHNFFKGCVLADVDGQLARTCAAVQARYHRAEHVRQRLEWVRGNAVGKLTWAKDARGTDALPHHLGFILGLRNIAALLPIAACINPTMRRCIQYAGDILAGYGRRDLHEELLGLLGSADLTAEQVERHVRILPAMQEDARSVFRTEYFGSFELDPLILSKSLAGIDRMVSTGYAREAFLYVHFLHYAYHSAIANDGDNVLRRRYRPHFDALMAESGINGLADLQARHRAALAYLDRLSAFLYERSELPNP